MDYSRLPLTPEKIAALRKRMADLGLVEADLEETFIHGSGKGGQKINKTASCVALAHRPSGLRVKCQQERSRELNRFFARRLLADALERSQTGELGREETRAAKVRKQKKRRARRSSSRLDAKN